jgi:hypothetical protein
MQQVPPILFPFPSQEEVELKANKQPLLSTTSVAVKSSIPDTQLTVYICNLKSQNINELQSLF